MPPRRQIEAFREAIEMRKNEGHSNDQIYAFLNEALVANGGSTVSFRTFKRQLSDWGLTASVPSHQKLQPLYEDICDLYYEGVSIQDILVNINSQLQLRNNVPISERTLYNQLERWGLNSRHKALEVSEDLINRVKYYFFNFGFSDLSILRDLQREGYSETNRWMIRRIRYCYGMKRRHRIPEEREETLNRAIEFLHQDLQQSTAILGFGKGLLYQYVRQQAQLAVSQRRLYDYYRSVFPEEVAGRRDGNFKQRGDFKVPGPNFLWSLDGYEKLKRFGFQIYGCIDAYSRCIIWFFIGRSATTSISTLKQYLQAVQRLQMRPFFTRSDHGVETPLWAAAQAALAKAGPKKLKYTDENGISHYYEQGDRLDSCHLYGPSTRNVKIESWWRQLRGGATDRWITFFNELAGYAIFRDNNLADQIAMYAIYGPIIRDELGRFVRLWNGHLIRNQPNRPNVRSGVPMDLYHTTEDPNWGVSLSQDDSSPDQQLLHNMLSPLEHIDIETLLPEETGAWCNQRLQEIGFEVRLDLEDDSKRPYADKFIQLRDLIESHQETGSLPILQLTPIATGGALEYERLLQRNYLADPSLSGDPLPIAFNAQIAEIQDEDLALN
jgi:hypothetical protein